MRARRLSADRRGHLSGRPGAGEASATKLCLRPSEETATSWCNSPSRRRCRRRWRWEKRRPVNKKSRWLRRSRAAAMLLVSGVLSDLGFQHLALVRPEIGLEAVFAINYKQLLFVASTTTRVYPKRKTAWDRKSYLLAHLWNFPATALVQAGEQIRGVFHLQPISRWFSPTMATSVRSFIGFLCSHLIQSSRAKKAKIISINTYHLILL